MTAAMRDSLRMRTMLAEVGITLDDRKPMVTVSRVDSSAAVVDREQIRAVLISAGAPERHLDWLTASCPSLEYALTYQPPEKP